MQNTRMGDNGRNIYYDYTRVPGEVIFPLSLRGMGQFFSDDQYMTERDGLEECLVIYTVSGSGLVEHQGQKRRVEKGDLVVIDCREYHRYRTEPGGEWVLFWVHFAGPAAFDFARLLNRGQFPVTKLPPEQFAPYQSRLITLCGCREHITELGVNQVLTELMTDLIYRQNEQRQQGTASNQEAVERALSYVENHYGEPLTVEVLAEKAMLSKYYFIRIFHKMMGLTPHQFILQVRVNEAKKLLLRTGLPVSRVAELCGFCDGKNLVQHFKKITGMTPMSFRKNTPAG